MDTTENLGNYSEKISTAIPKVSGNLPTQGNKNPDVFSTLTSLEGWQENVLNAFQQATYHARFFILSDEPGVLNSPTSYKSYDDYVNAINNVNQTILAESGVSTINIAKVNIRSTAATNQATKSMAATTISITIREPMSSSFMDLIADSASELKIRNLSKVPYYLELSFMGYDADGNIQVNPCGSASNKGKWLYRVAIKDISVNADATGSSYVVNCIPYEELMYQDSEMRLPNSISPKGQTIGELLKDLCEQLTQSYKDMYGYALRSYDVIFRTLENYDSTVPVDISKFSLKPIAPDINSKRSYSMQIDDNKNITAHFDRGLTLQSVIELAFANSEEAQQLAKDAPQNETDNNETKIRDCVIFRFDVITENTGYDHLTEQYVTKYTLVVAPYYTQRPILSNKQIKDSADSTLQTANLKKLRENNFLVKRYDYLFTGLNTDVINFDTKTNLSWSAVLPRVAGFRNSSDSETVHALLNTKDNLDKRQKDLQTKQDARAKYLENQVKIADLSTDKDTNKKEIAERQAQQAQYQNVYGNEADLATQASALGADVAAFNKTQESKYKIERIASQKYRFAEDVKDEKEAALTVGTIESKDRSPVKISLLQDTQDSRFLLSGAMPDFSHRDRALYGAVLDQIYAPLDKSMQSMNLDITGDPYWLGAANVERSWRILNDQANGIPAKVKGVGQSLTMPYYPNGDVLVMITFKYPTGVNDDGSPLLRNNNFFTGIYWAKQVSHDFENGQFRQRLELQRMPLIDVYKALGYVDSEEIKSAQAAKQKEIDMALRNQVQ